MKNLKRIIISIFILSCFLTAGSLVSFANTPTALDTNVLMPSSYQEYFELNSPTDIYYDSEITAVLEVTELNGGQKQTRLVTYSNGTYKTAVFDFTLSQLCRFGNFLITAKESRPYLIDINTLTISSLDIKDIDGNDIDIHCFSANSNYFATKNKAGISIYKVTALPTTVTFEKLENTIYGVTSSDSTKIALNEENHVLYIKNNGKLANYHFDENTPTPDEISYDFFKPDGIITDIIANGEFFYVLSSDSLQKLNIENGTQIKEKYLVLDEEKIDDLVSPKSMVFKDGNLLISDNVCNKLVELSSEDLSYTGFAVTTVANADNRLTANTKDISVSGNKIAILNGENSFTVKNEQDFTVYSDLSIKPSFIALGKNKVALTENSTLIFVDLLTKEETQISLETHYPLTSICYAGGKFYLSTYEKVFIVNEDSCLVENSYSITLSLDNVLTADVDGNVYVYSKNNLNSPIISKYDKLGNKTLEFNLTYESIDLGVDLNGNVYSLADNNILEYVKDGVNNVFELTISQNLPTDSVATSLALSYDNDNVYFLFNGKGFVLYASDAKNDSIVSVVIPTDFALTGDTANAVDTLKLYNLIEGANVYEVSTDYSGETFKYLNLSKADKTDYVYAGTAYSKTSNGTNDLLVLVNENHMILIKSSDATLKQLNVAPDITNGFTGTKFNLYYYPILTLDGLYSLSDATLNKNTAITIGALIEINGRSFYYVTVNGKSGYIIKTAVTEKLAEQFVCEQFAYKTLKQTEIYKDATMSEVLTVTDSKFKVKATATSEEIYYVEFTAENGDTISGFVYASDFTVDGKNAVRNAVIIAILALAVTATSIFFIYRKKR